MCGLSGSLFFNSKNFNANISREMINKLIHRGPDNLGEWANKSDGIVFNHTRLSILDLSNLGNQPMISKSKRWIMIFNGEIYNYKQIKTSVLQSKGIMLEGNSDSEVLINCLDILGINKTLEIIDGMFAIAIWDVLNKDLYLIRDRAGEKPLYYFKDHKAFFFASELKSLITINNIEKKISNEALSLYFKIGFIPSNLCIYENIHKVKPGECLKINKSNESIIKFQYWNIENYIKPKETNLDDEIKILDGYLNESVRDRLNSDVPSGTLLSGGVDSSLVSYYAQKNSIERVRTYSIGFFEKNYDETAKAKEISNLLNSSHNHLYIQKDQIINLLPKLPSIYCEPIADSSQIPTYLISNLISQHVKVALSGDGGDELFAGYNRHIYFKLIQKFNSFPNILKKYLNNNIFLKQFIAFFYSNLMKESRDISHKKINKFFNILSRASDVTSYFNILSNSNSHKILNDEYVNNSTFFEKNNNQKKLKDLLINDFNCYLPDDILTKVDRASMANSIEIRSPFLSRKLIEHSFSMNENFKIKNMQGKYILRQLMRKNYNSKIANLPKQGFSIPLGTWMKNDLSEWSKDIIFSTTKSSHLFDKRELEKIWKNFTDNTFDYSEQLWSIIIFKQWYENQF